MACSDPLEEATDMMPKAEIAEEEEDFIEIGRASCRERV